ncbi:PTS system trehalose-specific EIIBC component [Peribacillus kribbensis]|uniref:PTS system trehalose-specific EIIBC component n=1 Tax=Peribacillus kribbensis TaxID=356658 RepID=UPI0004019134|nr:PTS system trehalose-specific EIIBC component [Peribacillus kribbensis]
MANNNRLDAEKIVDAVGGSGNIASATHCVTRLRFALHDEKKVDKQKLDDLDVVKGSFSANGQFQVVIGQGLVDKVYAEMVDAAGIGTATKEDTKSAAEKNLNPVQRAIKTLADIFIPILPAIVTAGLLMGINNILTGSGIFYDGKSFVDVHSEWKDFASIINLIANTAFTFLPALVGWSAVKRFGGSPLLGIVLGLILVHPDLLNAWGYAEAKEAGKIPTWNLFGWHVNKVGYQGQILPILFASLLLAKIETFLNKRTPDTIKLLVVAPVALLVTGFLAFTIIGPVTFGIGNAITHVFTGIFDKVPALGGLIYGALYGPLVITGMHHTFLAVDFQLIASIGGTFLWPIVALSNIAQGSSALAMMFITRDEKVKGLSLSSSISAFLGVTEPAMFGVNLRFRYPFFAAMTGSALGAVYITVNKVMAPSIGVGGLPAFFSIVPQKWAPFFVGMAIALVVPFVLTFILGKFRKQKA